MSSEEIKKKVYFAATEFFNCLSISMSAKFFTSARQFLTEKNYKTVNWELKY